MIQLATRDDLEDLMKIEELSFDKNSSPLSKRSFIYHIKNSNIYVIRSDEKIVGYILFVTKKYSDTVRIYSIAVSIRSRGYGQALLDFAIERSERFKKDLTLEVRVDNQKAIDLYTKNGFVIEKRLESYYSDGADGLKMVRSCG